MAPDILLHEALPFPKSLPEFQRLFPDDAACAAYLERARWADGFACPHCGCVGEPFRIATRPGVLTCRKCRKQTGLTVGTVMERSHTPLNIWFSAACLVASQTPGISAVQFQRQLGLTRYETAFQILHKLRAGMVRPDADHIGGDPKAHVEVDETWIGGKTRLIAPPAAVSWSPSRMITPTWCDDFTKNFITNIASFLLTGVANNAIKGHQDGMARRTPRRQNHDHCTDDPHREWLCEQACRLPDRRP